MEPIRLWRRNETWHTCAGRAPFFGVEYAALPRAEYDALAAEAADARTLRAERDSLVKERDVAVREQEAWRLAYVSQARKQEDATARADAADERAKAAEALLREARVWVHDGVMGRFTPRSCAETVMARIDAHLDGGA